MEKPHPLVDILAVLFELRERGHRDYRVIGGVEFLELRPRLAVVVREREIEAVRLVFRRGPVGTAGYHHELGAAVREVKVVKGGRLLRVAETRRKSRHPVRPRQTEIGTYAHGNLALSVAERVHHDDVAVVGVHGVGVRDVPPRFFHGHRRVRGQLGYGNAYVIGRLVQRREMRRHENDGEHDPHGEHRGQRYEYLFAVAPEFRRKLLFRLLCPACGRGVFGRVFRDVRFGESGVLFFVDVGHIELPPYKGIVRYARRGVKRTRPHLDTAAAASV